jgi:hypothetical protein
MFMPTQKPSKPLEGMTYFDPTTNMMTVWDGKIWKTISTVVQYCCLCKKADYDHEPYSIQDIGHPLFHNNLEYLEWKYERTTRN